MVETTLTYIPRSIPAALAALDRMEADISDASTYEQLRRLEDKAEGIKHYFTAIDKVRQRAEQVIISAKHRVGLELQRTTSHGGAREGSGPISFRGKREGSSNLQDCLNLKKAVGSNIRGQRLRKLGSFTKTEVKQAVKHIHEKGEEATIASVLRTLRPEPSWKDGNTLKPPSKLVTGICRQLDHIFTDAHKLQRDLNYVGTFDTQLDTPDRRQIERRFVEAIERAQRSLDRFREMERGSGARVVNLKTIGGESE